MGTACPDLCSWGHTFASCWTPLEVAGNRSATCCCSRCFSPLPARSPKQPWPLTGPSRVIPAPRGRCWRRSISGAPQCHLFDLWQALQRSLSDRDSRGTTGRNGRNGGSAGACEPHVSLTHEAESKRAWEAGQGAEMCCVSFLLAGRGWRARDGVRQVGHGRCSALLGPGMGAQLGGGGMEGSRACPGHTAEHVFPAERRRVLRSCRVTLQSAGHGCAGASRGHGRARGALSASPFLVVIGVL